MTLRSLGVVLAFVGAASMGVAVQAHHSFSMFEMDKDVTYSGTVLEYHWINPHSQILVKIDPAPGVDPSQVGTWDIEGGSTNIMGRQGWTRATYKAGDKITLVAHPMKNGSKGASLFYAIKDGKRLYHDIARPKGEGAQPN